MSDHAEKVATSLDIRREIVRKTRRRHVEHIHEELNITAMLDMMTIILVFLLKTLSSSANNVPQSNDLQIPRSNSLDEPSQALQVIVSRVSITVNGRGMGVTLRNGLVDPTAKRGGQSGFLINALNREMRDQHEQALGMSRATNQPFDGQMALIADSSIPLRTIYEVLYTCGQNGFSNFRLLVLKGASN